MTKYAEHFTIRGNLRIDANCYEQANGNRGAQVLCFADIEYDGRKFTNLLLLKLDVIGHQEDGWHVMDEFSTLVPYMKPVATFRKYISNQLMGAADDLRAAPGDPRRMGIFKYLNELESFDETLCLVGQITQEAQSAGRRLKREYAFDQDRDKIDAIARQVLKVMGKKPKTEVPFVVADAVG